MRFDYAKNVLDVYGFFWQRVWKDENFISGLAAALGTLQQQTDITLNEFREYVSRITIPIAHHQRWKLLSFRYSDMTLRSYNFSDGLQIDKSVLIGSPVPPTQYVLPWVSTLQTPFITNSPSLTAGTLLNINVDYRIDGDKIIFYENPFTILPNGSSVDAEGNPVNTVECWGYCSEEDIAGIRNFFGTYVGVNTRSTNLFNRLTSAIWDLYVQGATISNINQFLLVLTDCDSVTAEGTVDAVFTEAGREWVSTETGLYSAPEGTGALVSVSDRIYKGQNIWDTFRIYNGYDMIPDTVVASFNAETGYLGGGYIAGLSFDNRLVPLTFVYMSTNPDITVLLTDTGEWLVTPANGDDIVLTSSTDYYSSGLRDQGVVLVPIFEIGGFQEDVDRLRLAMARNIWTTGADVYADLTEGQAPPFEINPFRWLQDNALKNNIMFVEILASALADASAITAAMRYLVNTVPAGTAFVISLKDSIPEEVYDLTSEVEETITGYIVADLEDEYDLATEVEEKIKANKKVG